MTEIAVRLLVAFGWYHLCFAASRRWREPIVHWWTHRRTPSAKGTP